jgi:hypothetical protein
VLSPRISPSSAIWKRGPQPPRELGELAATTRRNRPGRLVRAQVQHQQRAFGQQRAAAHGAQVVQQRQQRKRHIATARRHAIEIRGQLLHRAQQRVETVGIGLAVRGVGHHVLRDVLHLFCEQRAAVNLGNPQRTAREVQMGREALDQAALLRPLAEGLEHDARFIELGGHFLRHELQRGVRLLRGLHLQGFGRHDRLSAGLNP